MVYLLEFTLMKNIIIKSCMIVDGAGSKIWGLCFGVSVPLVLCQLYDLHH